MLQLGPQEGEAEHERREPLVLRGRARSMGLPAAPTRMDKPDQARLVRQARVVAPVSDQLKYTINQAAQRLGCCPRTVHNLCAKGKLHKRYENRKPYILHSDMSHLKTLPRIPTA
jgi:Helix-turn-helix domain